VRRSWASVTVGALVLVVGVVSYLLIRSTSERASGNRGYTVWGLFHDASGLFEKSRVQTAGISIGQIDKRELDMDTAKAKITIRMQPNIRLYENATVTKKSASLLGEYYLEIDPGTPFALVDGQRRQMRQLGDGDELKHVIEPVVMADIMADVGRLMPILHDILDDVRKLTAGPISSIAENVNEVIETNSQVLNRLLDRVDRIAANVEGVTTAEAQDVKESIRNVREITESIKSLIGTTHGEVSKTSENVQSSIQRLQSTIDSLDKAMKHVEAITTRVDEGKGTVGHLVNDDTIARNVEDITEDASGFVRGLTKLQTIVGLRTEYNLLSRAFKSYVSVQLMPRPDKFYLIEIVQDPRGYKTTTNTFTQSSMGESSATTVTITDQLRFSIEFGKRVGPWQGRFGIIESTGGLGGDLYLLEDRLSLHVDIFDTRTNLNPRARAAAWLSIWRPLTIVAGVDDFFNFSRARLGAGGGFDWFVGAQLTFNDEDLKTLLLFGGGAVSSSASSNR
jgi:phospholipid/cholesterol/gamma-HCH transport system substrate-binding protein